MEKVFGICLNKLFIHKKRAIYLCKEEPYKLMNMLKWDKNKVSSLNEFLEVLVNWNKFQFHFYCKLKDYKFFFILKIQTVSNFNHFNNNNQRFKSFFLLLQNRSRYCWISKIPTILCHYLLYTKKSEICNQ